MTEFDKAYASLMAQLREELKGLVPEAAFDAIDAFGMIAVVSTLYERGTVYREQIDTADPAELSEILCLFPGGDEAAAIVAEMPAEKQVMCAGVLKFMYYFSVEYIEGTQNK